MATKINIEDVIEANNHNSAMALTAAWSKMFKKYALNETEELTDDPGNSFNIFMHLTAQGAAKMMYESAARINETNESTAILPKSLINKLNSDELLGIFGTPASTTIAFCLKKEDILKYAIDDIDTPDLKKIIINKNMTAVFESHPGFTLPYDVIVNVKQLSDGDVNIFATYDMPDHNNDGMRLIYGINNQYISSREMRYDGDIYVVFFLKMFQMERKETEIYVSDPNTADTTISFNDSLIGVEVFRTRQNKSGEVLMKGFTDGSPLIQNSYNYSYDYKRNKQNYNITFSKMNNVASLTIGDKLRIVTYTTKGEEGNIKFPNMINNLNSLSINYAQDLAISYQNTVMNIVVLAFARDEASTGGSNQTDIEQIRAKVINKKYTRNILISGNEIVNKAKEYGLDAWKYRHDVINLYYKALDKLVYNNMILSTGSNNFYFDLKRKPLLINGYNYYMIEPTDVFSYDSESRRFEYSPKIYEGDPSKNLKSWKQYILDYNDTSNIESILQAQFPFHIRYENSTNPKITVYDMTVNKTEILSFKSYKEDYALDKVDVPFLKILRNPFKGSIDGTFEKDLANTYFFSFVLHTGSNTLEKIYAQCHDPDDKINYVNSPDESIYLKQYISFNLKMIGKNTGTIYVVDPTKIKIINVDTMLEDGYIAYQATVTTNNFVTDESQIQLKGIRNTSLVSKDYTVFYSVDTEVKFELSAKFYGYNDCISYETDYVKLVENMSESFGLEFDIETRIPGYETYEQDIGETYKTTEYVINKNYDPKNENKSDPNHYENVVELGEDGLPIFISVKGGNVVPKFKILHKAGDFIYDYTKLTEDEIEYGPDDTVQYYTYDPNYEIYTLVSDLDDFEPGVDYYTAKARIKHKKGDTKWYKKVLKNGVYVPGELSDLSEKDAFTDPTLMRKALTTEYIGIIKNVPWINRLYFSSEDMFNTIREKYLNITDNISKIRSNMFDGGKIFGGLKNTSGKSSKYKAFLLSTNTYEYISNIALKIEFRVKFKTNESIEFKRSQIIYTTANYIETLGDNNFSTDSLFEAIKGVVPDIEYINIVRINDYKNGEVQTIVNDTSISTEVLTVSQKVTSTDDGSIIFEPDITVNVVGE